MMEMKMLMIQEPRKHVIIGKEKVVLKRATFLMKRGWRVHAGLFEAGGGKVKIVMRKEMG